MSRYSSAAAMRAGDSAYTARTPFEVVSRASETLRLLRLRQWGDSSTFEDRDLPNLAKAAADIHTWIYQQKANAVTVNSSDAARRIRNSEVERLLIPLTLAVTESMHNREEIFHSGHSADLQHH
ncbi:MAG: hypothetical protein MUF48_23505 [Pirellulaceae bacterium]|jgi:hypothetical protein|nr:hypothetical protein [Pirellulaceae bacterium]